VVDDLSSAYSKRMIQITFDSPRIRLSDMGGRSSPHVIYIAIDPSGGGASKFSLVSLSLYQLGTRLGDTMQSMAKRPKLMGADGAANTGREQQTPVGFLVHGMENEPIMNRDGIWVTVISHIRNLRKKHPPGDCLICVGTENNLGNEASHISHMLRGEENLVCLAEGKNNKSGFCTTNARSLSLSLLLTTFYFMTSDPLLIVISSSLFFKEA